MGHDPADHVFLDPLAAAPPARAGDHPAALRLGTFDGATVVVMRFAAGQRLDAHRAPHAITVQALTGELDFRVGDESGRLTPGRLVYVRAGVHHAVHAPVESVMLLTLHTGDEAGFRHSGPDRD
ncbi:cupin domain-containing protein [Corynebacterium sphenisci]|uniref:cupin domain-containing protein n=1 Tax=Corynebacterium sphenisci TaxID=191493 RepID=UPI0026E0FB7A|nr:cupin domain-containing protein [Corynebacterium sphenisci]MDO5731861.1 cupin domain-containing protein [Corynebacterium sphenisci]